MTADYGLAVAPSGGMAHAVAPGVYREVAVGDTVCGSVSYGHPRHSLRAWLSLRQVLEQSEAAIKAVLFSIDIRWTLSDDHYAITFTSLSHRKSNLQAPPLAEGVADEIPEKSVGRHSAGRKPGSIRNSGRVYCAGCA